MKELGKTWLEFFKELFVDGKKVSDCGIMKWERLNEFEATVEAFSVYIQRYEVAKDMKTAIVYLTPEMIKYLENEVNCDK